MTKKRICFIVAVPITVQAFLRDHINALSEQYEVYVAGNFNSIDEFNGINISDYQHIDIMREISIFRDIKAVCQLVQYFRKMKFDCVHSVTPKAGLICALASKIAGIKNRIHIFTGQVWATREGIMRFVLKSIDKIIATLNTKILVDGKPQREFLISEGVVSNNKSQVLGDGSISGVNTTRFNPSKEIRNSIRKELKIDENKVVFVFMGRMNHDKGIYELLSAFNRLAKDNANIFLLIIGMDEENVASSFCEYNNLNDNNFLFYGFSKHPEETIQAGDVFVLPTYREGFGTSVLEAACVGLPTITTDVYGVKDASIPGETGLQCKVRDVDSLYCAMKDMADCKEKRENYGEAGRKRVIEKFSSSKIVEHWVAFYNTLLR